MGDIADMAMENEAQERLEEYLHGGNPVALTSAQIIVKRQKELEQVLARATNLSEEINRLIEESKKPEIPTAPLGHRFSIQVRYSRRGRDYEYLILRIGNRYYTTGIGEDTKMFPSWRALVRWLQSDEVYWHGALWTLDEGIETTLPAKKISQL